MVIGIHGKNFKEEAIPYVKHMLEILRVNSVKISLFEPLVQFLDKKGIDVSELQTYNHYNDLLGFDFIFTVGGDGTLLDAVTYVRDREIPLLAINAGRLGFLATTQPHEIQNNLNDFVNKKFSIESRTMIKLESDKEIFSDTNFGLNEFTILKKDTSSMIVVHAYIDDEYLNSYWADGLIVATPTGSTGYSLSCGGPLVMPSSNNFIIAPISPHNLNVRPMVVSDSSSISFKIESRSKNILVALDSRSKSIPHSTLLKVKKETFSAKMVKFNNHNFLDTLRKKLNWGLDMRN
jgi:NAD+ kinase